MPPNRDSSHIQIAVPTRGQIQWQTVHRLNEIRDGAKGLPPVMFQPGNLSVALTRNKIVRRFLDTDREILIMVDSDIVPPLHTLGVLTPVPDGYGIVGIPHPHQFPGTSHLVLSAYRLTSQGLANMQEFSHGLNDVDAIATGCVAIPRSVLEMLGPDPFRIAHNPTDTITSDDFLFCADVRAAGLKVGSWFDGQICDHIQLSNLAGVFAAGGFGHAM